MPKKKSLHPRKIINPLVSRTETCMLTVKQSYYRLHVSDERRSVFGGAVCWR